MQLPNLALVSFHNCDGAEDLIDTLVERCPRLERRCCFSSPECHSKNRDDQPKIKADKSAYKDAVERLGLSDGVLTH